MSKMKYEVLLPKSQAQLDTMFANLYKNNGKHLIVRIFADYLTLEDLLAVLEKNKDKIERFRRNKSLVLLTGEFNYEQIPEFVPVAPTEEEALDVIEFEEIERQLMSD